MSRPSRILVPLAAALLALAVTGSAAAGSPAPGRAANAGRWIVAMTRADGSAIGPAGQGRLPMRGRASGHRQAARSAQRLVRDLSIRPTHRYRRAFDGFAATLDRRQLAAILRDPAVSVVVPDSPVGLEEVPEGDSLRKTRLEQPVVPTGVRRVRADVARVLPFDGVDDAPDVDVAIVDTGIAPSDDLRIAGGHDCSGTDPRSWRDREGHGTHVAGTVAARDDGQGVVGVAPGARLWAIKVLDDRGEGWLSALLCGTDRILGMRDPADASRPLIEVVNMSIGWWLAGRDDRDCGRPSGDLFHGAVCALVADGTVVVAAAGNQETNSAARSPAAYDEAITVSALADFDGSPGGVGRQEDVCPWYASDEDDTYADFSNGGADVDLIAPGKCILSTYPDGWYAWSSGTSMATPHVAGAAALVLAANPGARPAAVRTALLRATTLDWVTATDPDGRPDRLLDVSALGPLPAFGLGVRAPAGPLAPGGLVTVRLSLPRAGGHDAPVAIEVGGLPAGIEAELAPSPTTGRSVALTLRAAPDAAPGVVDVTVRASDGSDVRTAALRVRVRADAPRAEFVAPARGTAVPLDARRTVVFVRQVAGRAGLVPRLQRQVAGPSGGSCAGVRWRDDGRPVDPGTLDPAGSPAAGWSFAARLPRDGCIRWVLGLTDARGRSARFASGAVLRDTTDPAPPGVRASGEGAWQGRADAPVWVRDGTGTLALVAKGVDAASGVAAHEWRVETGPGWSADPAADGAPDLTLHWSPGAAAGSVSVSAIDGVGRRGPARMVELIPDGTPPVVTDWRYPRPGTEETTGAFPDLTWGRVDDAGSGAATLQRIARDSAAPSANGTCEDVAWAADGEPFLGALPHEDLGVTSGRCYRWTMWPLDRVGNAGPPARSGVLLVDLLPPAGDFDEPDEGTVTTITETSVLVRWRDEERGGVEDGITRVLERERTGLADGACDESRWRVDGAPVQGAGPVRSGGLEPGSCYRWRLNLEDAVRNPSAWLSGTIIVVAP